MIRPLLLLLVAVLSACSTVQPQVVTKTEYIRKQAPAEMYELTPAPTTADLTTQKGVALWIVDTENALNECKIKIDALRGYFEK